jgi:hypothetical protein
MPTKLGDPGERLLGVGVALEVDDHHVEAGPGQRQRAAAPDAAPAAGDQRRRSIELLAHAFLPGLLQARPPRRRTDAVIRANAGPPKSRSGPDRRRAGVGQLDLTR